MKKQLLILIFTVFIATIAVGQSDSVLMSNFNKLHIKPTKRNIALYTEILQWGLMGFSNSFAIDETEVLIEEWLEYIYYQDYKKIKSYIEKNQVTKKNTSIEEKELLLNAQIDSNLLPIKQVLHSNSQYYIFSKCKNCALMSVEGLHGRFLLPVDSDSLNNKQSLKRLKYYLELPITGISYEQAFDFCKWRTTVDSLIVAYNLDSEDHSKELAKSKLWFENTQLRCFKYYLPTPEQFDKINFSLDSNSVHHNLISGYNYKDSKYSKRKKKYENNLRCGKMPISGFAFYHPPHTKMGWWVKNTQGNVAEMTIIKGIARGGSYFHNAKDSYPGINNYYTKPEPWLGFRCIGI